MMPEIVLKEIWEKQSSRGHILLAEFCIWSPAPARAELSEVTRGVTVWRENRMDPG